MPKSVCPVCGKSISLQSDEAVLYERIYCPHCDSLLEVIDEDPLMLDEAIDD
jgi:lysine biosynthesis protein LysW